MEKCIQNKEAQVFVHDLNLFVTVQLLEETLAILSPVKLCEDHGYSNEWVSGQKPRVTKDEKSIICKTDNFVPLVVPGLSTNPDIAITGLVEKKGRTSIQGTGAIPRHPKHNLLKRDGTRDSVDRLRDLLCLLEDFKGNLKDTELHAPSTQFSGLRFGTSCESGIKIKEAQYSYSLLKRPKLRRLLENQKLQGLLAEDTLAKLHLEQKSLVT